MMIYLTSLMLNATNMYSDYPAFAKSSINYCKREECALPAASSHVVRTKQSVQIAKTRTKWYNKYTLIT